MLKELYSALYVQLRIFRNTDQTGENFTKGGDIVEEISDRISLDTPAANADVIVPILDTLRSSLKKFNVDNISDILDARDIHTLYTSIIAIPHMLMANGIANYIIANKSYLAVYYGDGMSIEDEARIKRIKETLNMDMDFIVVLYFLDKIVRDFVEESSGNTELKFNELDFHINAPIFKKLMNLNIISETNVYYSEILYERLQYVDDIIYTLVDMVKVYIKNELTNLDELMSSETFGFLMS